MFFSFLYVEPSITTHLISNSLRFETNRLATFFSCDSITACRTILAETGFFWLGPGDLVECYFCHIQITNWAPGDDEVIEHIRYSMNCPLLNREQTNNVPIDQGNIFLFTFFF